MCQEGAPAEVISSRRNLKVVEYLGGEAVKKRTQQKTESLRDSVRTLPGGHRAGADRAQENFV
jgi:hypothetical protein